MTRVKVKICGIRSLEEAEAALDEGADALGFNFWPKSPRYITPRSASEIIARLSPIKTIKAIRVGQDFDLSVIEEYSVAMVLLDSDIKGSYGGTGRRFDWRIAVEAKRFAPIILAGGLNTENVWDAITHVRPAAIDVCSGVEAEPGRKDLTKLRSFMAVVARANALIAGEADEAAQISRGFLP